MRGSLLGILLLVKAWGCNAHTGVGAIAARIQAGFFLSFTPPMCALPALADFHGIVLRSKCTLPLRSRQAFPAMPGAGCSTCWCLIIGKVQDASHKVMLSKYREQGDRPPLFLTTS